MEIKQLKALQAIAATGSFQKAAEQLGLTQSALSHSVRTLEEELGETLLIRARPNVFPSPAGLVALESAQRILGDVMALETRFASARRGAVAGTLRIAATTLSIVYALGDLCQKFIERYPSVELVFTACETAEAARRRVVTGAADLAFGPLLEAEGSFTQVALAQVEHAFIVRKGHALSEQSTATLTELRAHPVVLFQPGSGTRAMTDGLFLREGQTYPTIVTESNDALFVKRMVSMSNASALMVVYALAGNDGIDQRLHMLRFSEHPLRVDVGVMHRKNVQMNSIELFKALCLDLRGQGLPCITMDRPDVSSLWRSYPDRA